MIIIYSIIFAIYIFGIIKLCKYCKNKYNNLSKIHAM